METEQFILLENITEQQKLLGSWMLKPTETIVETLREKG